MKNLSVGRKKRLLLKNINLELFAGRKWFFYGTEEAQTIFYLLSGLIRDYSGTVNADGFVPARRDPGFFAETSFIPSYFPVFSLSCGLYIHHYKKIYPGLDSGMLRRGLDSFGIHEKQNLQKLPFNIRKIFHIILALSRRPKFIMVKDLFHGLTDRNSCCIHNLFQNFTSSDQCLVFFGGKLEDYRDMIDDLAFFSNGIHIKNYTIRELGEMFRVLHVRSRRYLDHAPLSANRLIRGWKVLDENKSNLVCPPDFSLLASYFEEAKDMVKIKDRMEQQDEG